MSHLIEVAFKGNRKEFFLWDGDDPPRVRLPIIVEGDRGEDMGHVHAVAEAAEHRFSGVAHGAAMLVDGASTQPQRRALRLATADDVRRSSDLVEQNESARRKAIERVKAHGLVMKVTDAEWQWDRRKLTLYFTAEKRVDFRALVRDLAALFRTRIELKQIGVRDEAKRLDGVGRCGREYCSASWLPELRPVNLSVAKDQHLSLNPTQISGACGRLMCSLRYEHEFYVQARKRFPKEGKILVTARGEEKVVANDIFRDRVTLRTFDGETRIVPLADLRQELASLNDREEGATVVISQTTVAIESVVVEAQASQPDDRRDDRRDADRRRNDRRRADEPVGAAPAPVEPQAIDSAEAVDVGDDDFDDEAVANADGTPVDENAPVRRRRRGRRGGRRGRSNAAGGSPPDAPDAPDATSDDA